MELNAAMSCPVPPDFWQPFFLNSGPFLLNEAPFLQKTVEKGKYRPWEARTGRSSLSKYSNSTSFSVATSFFHVFHTVFPLFLACLQSFKGLLKHSRRSVETVQGHFCTFPIKIFLLIANLLSDWSNTTERFLYNTVSAAISGNATVAASFSMRSRIALLCNTWATRGRLERRLNSCREEGEA